MTGQPSNLLLKLSRRLLDDAPERERFIAALCRPRPQLPCVLWLRDRERSPFAVEPPVSWQPPFVQRLAAGEQPGRHPLHEAGAYYVLDFSSVFAASPLLALPRPVGAVADLCAAPGGKSVFAWRALRPDLLLCNEVVGKRLGSLVANLRRCHIAPAVVVNEDTARLAEALPGAFPVVLVDAPCTGQSLLAKGEEAPGCFHPATVNGSANRQKKIVANAAALVAPGGHLLYMTCTYAPEENEQVCAWFLKRFPQFQTVPVPFLAAHQSPLTALPCYRMWPQEGLGAGAFTALFQNTETGDAGPLGEDALASLRVVTSFKEHP